MKKSCATRCRYKAKQGSREGYTTEGKFMLLIANAHLQFGTCCICSINEKFMYAFEVLILQLKLFKGYLQDITYPVCCTVSEGWPSTTALVGKVFVMYPSGNSTGCFQMLLNSYVSLCDSVWGIDTYRIPEPRLCGCLYLFVYMCHMGRVILLNRVRSGFAKFLKVPNMLVIDTDTHRM